MPDQTQANAWAGAGSNGLINQFPLQLDELTRLVLASALATDIGWAQPLGTTKELGGVFGKEVSTALTFRDGIQLIAPSGAAICRPGRRRAITTSRAHPAYRRCSTR
ncbi:hypothetical protein [Mycobacterium sp. DL440]|uniref:hypothetical protein n=1 Tax=Mycobacterium sp. DL440 TaxID=2675523 RepID=UPI00142225A8|nr:hypothetical protein [Mycobacterium sp. DL440]